MAINLLDSIKGGISSDLISKAASMLGENGEGIQKALSGAVPSILGGIMNKITDTKASAGVMSLIESGEEDGSKVIDSIFGDKAESASTAIAAHAGIKAESAKKVLSMAAPLVSGGMGKLLAGSGGLAGLAALLFSNLDSIKAALPSGILDKIGIGSLDEVAEKAKNIYGANALSGVVASSVAAHNSGHGHGHGHHHDDKKVEVAPFVKIFPWVGGLSIVALAWFLMSRGNQHTTAGHEGGHGQHEAAQHETVASTHETKEEAKDTTSTMTVGALGEKYKVKIASGIELDIPNNGIEDRIIKFIENKNQLVDKQIWFNFDRINFGTNSADLTKESSEQVNNMVEILKAYPEVEFKIGGYTDNVGNAVTNIGLSQKRADAVMNAIAKGGIDPKRLKAEGFGDQFPEASNDTEEGRAKNRRIAVSIRKK